MNLLIDWGNTQLKFMGVDTFSKQAVAGKDVHTCVELHELKAQLEQLGISRIDTALISSVRDDYTNEKLNNALDDFCNKVIFAKTSKSARGIRCAYDDPQFLGIDRWLAAIAGSKCFIDRNESITNEQKVIGIISVGTAITLDLVNKKAHLGGHILPGQALMFDSLKQTGRVWASEKQEIASRISLGQSTSTCVAAGIDAAIEGYLSNTVKVIEDKYPIDTWLIHGGGGLYWKERLFSSKNNLSYQPKLVFEGLCFWYQGN